MRQHAPVGARRGPQILPSAVDRHNGARAASTSGRIRIAMLDADPTIRARVEAIVGRESDVQLVASAAVEAELPPLLHRNQPAVVVLGLDRAGLDLCLGIRSEPRAPAAVLYGPSSDAGLVTAAAIAGAGAVIDTSSPASELLATIRELALGPQAVAPVSPRLRREAATQLDPADYPIVAMRLAGEPVAEIAKTLGLSPLAIQKRIGRILARLVLV
jgi:DNA-binding NarL/FixJ family response regulator